MRKSLKQLKRAQGHPVVVAGDGAACSEALDAIIANDPLLNVHRVDAPPGRPSPT